VEAPAAISTAREPATPAKAQPEAAQARKEAEQAAEAQAKVKQAQATAGFKAIAGPPLPISDSKEARLQELLKKYKADEITPDEYHKQRTAILAEP
jgi:hypothetical protein